MSKVIIEYLGPTPCDEDCAQSIHPNFQSLNMAETKRFKELLEKVCPPPNENGFYKINREDGHDFGMYREVVVMVDDSLNGDEMAIMYEWSARASNLPSTWAELEALTEV